MIVSHKLKCIFIKTGKTGGTSFEIALSKYLGPEDIITPISKEDEILRKKLGFRCRQNYRKPLRDYKPKELFKLIFKGIKAKRFWNHMSSEEIKERIGDDKWESYLKFTIERNPFDKIVSAFFWDERGKILEGEERKQFSEYVKSERAKKCDSSDRYSINGEMAMDFYIKFENLENDLKELSDKLAIDENLFDVMKNIKAKGQHRKKRHYSKMYDQESINYVEDHFSHLLKAFDYHFEKV